MQLRAVGVDHDCTVTYSKVEGRYRIQLDSTPVTTTVDSDIDFEDALIRLWDELDERHAVLGCNRFHRFAVVSHMSRSMSEGVTCYLQKPHRAVGADDLANCFDPAPLSEVTTAEAARLRAERAPKRPTVRAVVGFPFRLAYLSFKDWQVGRRWAKQRRRNEKQRKAGS